MRVIAGSAKGIHLKVVPGDTTRPILDRVKTPLFDILRPELEGTRWLDMFSGTGAVGIEALSQGAVNCTFLDIEQKAIAVIQDNLKATKLSEKAKVFKVDAFRYLKTCKDVFDVIFIAPPQYERLWAEAVEKVATLPELVAVGGKVIVQIDYKEFEEITMTSLKLVERRKYGNTEILFYDKI